jgi:hypothetical protein
VRITSEPARGGAGVRQLEGGRAVRDQHAVHCRCDWRVLGCPVGNP